MAIELKKTNEDLLIRLLLSVLADNGKVKQFDVNHNVIHMDYDIFSKEALTNFLELSLSNFNQMPQFTNFTFDDDKFVNTFKEILVSGAALYALSSQALIERGREFTFSAENGGINLAPPNLAEMLSAQHQRLLNHHFDKLTIIKRAIGVFL